MDISLFSLLLLLGLLACACCETCPPPEDISPCKCTLLDKKGNIFIYCDGVGLKEIDDVFDNLRGKTIDTVSIENVKGDRLSSLLFWKTRVRWIRLLDCDLQGLSDSDSRPAFLGLENSLERLSVTNSIKEENQLRTLDLSHLKHLSYLSLYENNIPEVTNDWFTDGPFSLTSVIFDSCGVKNLGDAAFAPLVNLQVLRLGSNRLTALKRSILPNPASHLTYLDLDDNNLTSLQNDIFSGMPSLQTVRLKRNSIKHIEENTWSSVWEKLDYLYLDDNPLECDSHMNWTFSINRPKKVYGTCDSPACVKGQPLLYFIESNRKFLSLTGKQSISYSTNELQLGLEDNLNSN